MSGPSMEPCQSCRGLGKKEVILHDGTKEYKRCWVCDGTGMNPVFKKPEAVKPPVAEKPKMPPKRQDHVNAPLGDLSWIPGRKGSA